MRERPGSGIEPAQSGEFYVEAPQPRDVPGPVFAVMSTLTERGPLTSKEPTRRSRRSGRACSSRPTI